MKITIISIGSIIVLLILFTAISLLFKKRKTIEEISTDGFSIRMNDWKVWLIRSTLGGSQLPKTLCSFYWVFVLCLILAPFAYVSHLSNIIFFRKEPKINVLWGIMSFLIGVPGIVLLQEIGFHIDLQTYTVPDRILIIYLGIIPGIIILLSVVIGVILGVFGIIYPFELLYKKWKRNKTAKQESMLSSFIDAKKNKYCPQMNYIKED